MSASWVLRTVIRCGEITAPGEEPRRVEILPAHEPVHIPEPVVVPEPEKVPA